MRTVELTLTEADLYRVYMALHAKIDQLRTRSKSPELRYLEQKLSDKYQLTLDKIADTYRQLSPVFMESAQ